MENKRKKYKQYLEPASISEVPLVTLKVSEFFVTHIGLL